MNEIATSLQNVRVFISYKRSVEPDESLALQIYQVLAKKYEVFLDRTLLVGTHWPEQIEAAICQSDFFIALLSAESVKSDMVKGEIEIAYRSVKERSGHPVILPVRLAYNEPYPYPLNSYLSHINWTHWQSHTDTPRLTNELIQVISNGVFLLYDDPQSADIPSNSDGLDGQILQTLFTYFQKHPGDPKMVFNDLVNSAKAKQAEVIQCLYGLQEKGWVNFNLAEKAESGLVWLTQYGIRVAQDAVKH